MGTKKTANLFDDEFNPDGAFNSFVRVPRGILEVPNVVLSVGAKLLYGVLVGFAGSYGTSYPTKERLKDAMGGPSLRTLLRWQRELVDAGLIRVKFKGRWLPNNYYFLRSGYLGNGHPAENAAVEESREDKRMRRERKVSARDLAAMQRVKDRKAADKAGWDKVEEFVNHPEVVAYTEALKQWIEGGKVGPAPVLPTALLAT